MNWGSIMMNDVKRFRTSSFGLVIIFVLCSCDDKDLIYSHDELDVTLRNTEQYEYNTKIAGDEEGANIITQAKHFEISEIVRDLSTSWIAVYKYKPESNFIGKDFVEIETQRGSDGESPPIKIAFIKINFTVIN